MGLVEWIMLAIDLATIVGAAFCLIDCLRRRQDAFPAVSRQTKPIWLALTAGSLLLALAPLPIYSMLKVASIVVIGVYLLDVRPKIIEVTRGY